MKILAPLNPNLYAPSLPGFHCIPNTNSCIPWSAEPQNLQPWKFNHTLQAPGMYKTHLRGQTAYQLVHDFFIQRMIQRFGVMSPDITVIVWSESVQEPRRYASSINSWCQWIRLLIKFWSNPTGHHGALWTGMRMSIFFTLSTQTNPLSPPFPGQDVWKLCMP